MPIDYRAPVVIAGIVLGVLAVVALLALGLWWWLLVGSKNARRWITGTLFVVGFGCAVSGFVAKYEAQGTFDSPAQLFADAVQSSVQLAAFGVDSKESHGWRLGIARVLIPLATAQLILAAWLTRARQWFLRGHHIARRSDVVILGCGETGLRIATLIEQLMGRGGSSGGQTSRRGRRRILGVDASLTTPEARAFQEKFWLLEAPLDGAEALSSLPLDARRGVVICTGDERRDVALLKRVVEVVKRPVAVVVSVDSDTIPRLCQVDPDLSGPYGAGTIQFVHPARLDARLLFQKHPPHVVSAASLRVGGPNRCHIAIVAADGVEALVAQAVRALVYDPAEPLRSTVLVPEAESTARRFFSRFPALTQTAAVWTDGAYGKQLPLAHIAFFESSVERIEAHVLRREHELHSIHVVYVVGRDDAETCLMAAETLKVVSTIPAPRPRVVVCLRNGTMGQRLLEPRLEVECVFFQLGAWAAPDAATSELAALLPDSPDRSGSGADTDAERLWRAYGISPGETWATTQYEAKWWNRLAADHAELKLALLGLTRETAAPELRERLARADARSWLARLEHRRYVCERMTDGWLLRGEPKVNEFRINPTFVPFDELRPVDREKDLRVVDDLVNRLDSGRG